MVFRRSGYLPVVKKPGLCYTEARQRILRSFRTSASQNRCRLQNLREVIMTEFRVTLPPANDFPVLSISSVRTSVSEGKVQTL